MASVYLEEHMRTDAGLQKPGFSNKRDFIVGEVPWLRKATHDGPLVAGL